MTVMIFARCSRKAEEVWGFTGCKDRNVPKSKLTGRIGSVWTWVAVDRRSKLILSWLAGDRDQEHARAFMLDFSCRVAARPQISTDALGMYASAVSEAFHTLGVDYGQIHKLYGAMDDAGRYSPSVCIGCERKAVRGNPNVKAIGTSRVERSNLTLRMSQRRWTRLTNAHSKSFAHMEAAFALHACWYNWVRKHMTLGTTPAKAAGITDREWTIADLVGLLEAEELAVIGTEKNRRGAYQKG